MGQKLVRARSPRVNAPRATKLPLLVGWGEGVGEVIILSSRGAHCPALFTSVQMGPDRGSVSSRPNQTKFMHMLV